MQDWQAWRNARNGELASPDSWLGLTGLFWLEHGLNSVGSDPASAVILPDGPPRLGEVEWSGGAITWRPLSAPAQPLASDAGGDPTVVVNRNSAFFVVDRDGRLAVRVRDLAWAAKRMFAGVSCFDYDPAWRIDAAWERLPEPLSLEVPNVTGELKPVMVDHRATFVVAGEKVEMLPMAVGAAEVFFVFRDRTSGRETYGAGRFLKASVPVDGRITVDFNFAYNPPCAFTAFATCPLPPPENWLPFAVPAGEKKWAEGA
ncbi:MAG: DUF1684 domain-containing protein [Betaproteobacteria bacterium]|nr:DUF1684 domain-containing protein [Betaproteobacteria bacterium]